MPGTEIENMQALSALINAVGVPIVALIVLFAMFRFERLRVVELEQKRIDDHQRFQAEQKAQNQQRVDDFKGWMQVLAGLPPLSRTPTNLGGD